MSLVQPVQATPAPNVMRWAVYGLAIIGVVLSGIFPSPAFTAAAIAISFATLGLTLWAPDLFVVMSRRKRDGALVATFNPVVGIPASALFFRAVGMDLVDFWPSWIAAVVFGAGFAVVGWLRRPARTPAQLAIYMGVFGLFLGYGAATQANVVFDAGPGDAYRATVIDLRVSHGKSTSYSVELSPWGPITGTKWQSVPHAIYAAVNAGDQLCLRLHPGKLGERWFTIDLCTAGSANG